MPAPSDGFRQKICDSGPSCSPSLAKTVKRARTAWTIQARHRCTSFAKPPPSLPESSQERTASVCMEGSVALRGSWARGNRARQYPANLIIIVAWTVDSFFFLSDRHKEWNRYLAECHGLNVQLQSGQHVALHLGCGIGPYEQS